jgi:outer membrane lipoprotein SlyB
MRLVVISAAAMLSFTAWSTSANAIGCLSGGAAGALAGHMAGHGVLGAIGGCIAGHAWHNRQMREQDLQDRRSYEMRRRHYDPNYQDPWGS